MSVVQNPLIGRARQKLGGTVFSTWKGINVIKGKPLTVANPRTDNQLMRRSALTQMVAIGRSIYGAVFLGFKEQAVRKSQFNAFTGYNLKNAFDYSGAPDATLLPDDLLVSQGTITPATPTAITATAATGIVNVEWPTSASLPGQGANDRVYCVLYNSTQDKWYFSQTTGTRSVGEADFAFGSSAMVAGNNLKVYTFFVNLTTGKSSTSVVASEVAA